MGGASAVVIWSWLFNRDALEPSYRAFVDRQGGKQMIVQLAYSKLHYGTDALVKDTHLYNKLLSHR